MNLKRQVQGFQTDSAMIFGSNKEYAYNSTYPKGGVSCSKDSFVVNQTLVFQMKFCGKRPALRVAAKRYVALTIPEKYPKYILN